MRICRWVRQGWILSPLSFNLYSRTIFNKALEETDINIYINGLPINNLSYADDTLIMAESMEEQQQLLNSVRDVNREMGLNVNDLKMHGSCTTWKCAIRVEWKTNSESKKNPNNCAP